MAANPDSVNLRAIADAFAMVLDASPLDSGGQLVDELRAIADRLDAPVELPAEVARRLVDILTRTEPWPIPVQYRPPPWAIMENVPLRTAANILQVRIDARPEGIHVTLTVDGGIPIGRHFFDFGPAASEPNRCPSPSAAGRQDRCGLYAFPPRCHDTGACTMPDASPRRADGR